MNIRIKKSTSNDSLILRRAEKEQKWNMGMDGGGTDVPVNLLQISWMRRVTLCMRLCIFWQFTTETDKNFTPNCAEQSKWDVSSKLLLLQTNVMLFGNHHHSVGCAKYYICAAIN